MTEKDNLEKGRREREGQGRVGNLECGLSDSAEPEASGRTERVGRITWWPFAPSGAQP